MIVSLAGNAAQRLATFLHAKGGGSQVQATPAILKPFWDTKLSANRVDHEASMTEPASVFDAIDEDVDAQAIEKARAEIAAGQGIPHEVVREWLLRLTQGEDVPPPLTD